MINLAKEMLSCEYDFKKVVHRCLEGNGICKRCKLIKFGYTCNTSGKITIVGRCMFKIIVLTERSNIMAFSSISMTFYLILPKADSYSSTKF